MPRWRIPRPRFSLLTLLLGVLFAGACFGLWSRWEPWVRTATIAPPPGQSFKQQGWIPDGKTLFTYMEQKAAGKMDSARVCLWSAESGRLLADEECFPSSPPVSLTGGSVSVSDGGRWLVWRAHRGIKQTADLPTQRIWDLRGLDEGKAPESMALSLADRILGTSPDDRLRVVMNAEGIWIEDAESDHRRSLLQKELCIDAAFSPDGKWLALADEQTRIWDVQTRKFHLAIPGSCPVFSPDGKDLLMVDLKFEKTSVYSVADGAVRFVLDGTLPLFGDYFDQGGQRMVTMQKDHWVVHDMERGREISRVQRNIESVAVRLSEDGRRLIGTSIWDASTGKEIASLGKSPVDVAMFTCVAGKRMALAETILSDRILIMDTETGALLYQIEVTKKRGFFNPLAWFSSQDRLMIYPGESVLVYSRRRPEYWWGIAWLPEFWVAYFSGGALLVIAARNLRRRFVRTTDGLASTQ